MSKIYPVIMSGGAGTRLWPLSRQSVPKQYHSMITEHTMFEETLMRLKSCGETKTLPPIIICAEGHEKLIKQQCANMDMAYSAIIIEPMPRNTAAVGAVAASHVDNIDPDGLILLLPADHHIEDNQGFWRAVQQGAELAGQNYLVTLGIQPSGPETGFGYIRRGEELTNNVYRIDSFKEKPSQDIAESYIASGDYFWNAGIFLFRAERLRKEYEAYAQDILARSEQALRQARYKDKEIFLDAPAFSHCRADSIDYAIMEKTQKAAIVAPVEIGWNDLGSWLAIHEQLQTAIEGNNICRGDVISLDTKNSLLRSDGPMLATLGVENLIIIATGDAVLVARRDRSQEIKKIIDILKQKNRTELL